MASPQPPPAPTNGSYPQQAGPHHSESNTGNSDVPKDEVGWYFVEQYYTTLNKTPERLHLFYNKTSSFVWGTEGENLRLTHGRSAIQDKIASYEFKDCKVRVSNVDAQSSADDGIVIQVLGEMSNNGLLNRKFSQTFFLAKQPNGYYVLNDIFRYLKDDEDTEGGEYDENLAEEVAEEAEVAEAITEEVIEAGEDMGLKETTTTEIEVQENKVAVEETTTIEPALPIPGAQGLPPPINGGANGSSVETPAEEPEAEVQPDPEPEPEPEPEPKAEELAVPPVEVVAEEPAPPVIAEIKPAQTPEKEPERRAVTPVPAAPPVPAGPTKATTWASIAKSASAGAPAAVPQTVTPPQVQQAQQTQPSQAQNSTTPATSTTASSATPSTPTTPRGGSQWHTTESKRHSRPASTSTNASTGQTSAYVRNVTESVSDRALEDTLSKFGALERFEVNRAKNCAFVEFETSAGFTAANSNNPHKIGDANVYVEERRPRGPVSGPGYSGGRGPFGNRDSRTGGQGGRAFSSRDGARTEGGRGSRGGARGNYNQTRGGATGRPGSSTPTTSN
ncbi:hypothetical protein C7212DRAFT_352732 [Tuber magnatum]|uniref:NTF2-domain-containing protein n=1 Tax=Tuber magnatum TaxID=42249 RepID=A0A317SLR4_9PEZI|nr:hypothetical protein C7212DRAFT_352732 [Tuber magnatum]